MKLLSTTQKLKKDGIYSFGLPAIKTCPNAKACKAGCYAQAGHYRCKKVKDRRAFNYMITQQNFFATRMIDEIATKKAKVIRIHDSGDFYSKPYLHLWIYIAHMIPDVMFYAYTKQVNWVKDAKQFIFPKNLKFIFSYGGTEDDLIDPKRDRHAKVFKTEEELEKAGYVNAMQSDLLALGKEHKIGLVYHGTKKYDNTEWSKT